MNPEFDEQTALNDPKYSAFIAPTYVEQFGKFVAMCNQVGNLVKSRYANDKIKEDTQALYSNFYADYQKFYSQAAHSMQNQIAAIKESYEETAAPAYTDATSALNELLRRQDFAAKVSLMTNDKLKAFTEDHSASLVRLPQVDQQAILRELRRRHIKYEVTAIEVAQDNQYQSDPNWQKLNATMANLWAIGAKDKNTTLAYYVRQDNGTYALQFVNLSLVDQLTGMRVEQIQETLKPISDGLTTLQSLSRQADRNKVPMMSTAVSDYRQSSDTMAEQYQVADNDPRINENGSHWTWVVFYTFLKERFADDPRVADNPVYSNALNPNYDIEKTYNLLKSIYEEKQATQEYTPVKLVQVPGGQNPETLSDSEIEKLFGEF